MTAFLALHSLNSLNPAELLTQNSIHTPYLHPNISSSSFCTSFHDFSENFQHFIPIISTKASQSLQMIENYRIEFVRRIIRVSTAPASDSMPLGSLRNPFTTRDNSTCTDRPTIQAIYPWPSIPTSSEEAKNFIPCIHVCVLWEFQGFLVSKNIIVSRQ